MAVDLPDERSALLTAPDAVETELLVRGIVSAVAPVGGLSNLQDLLLSAVTTSMTGHLLDPADLEPIGADEFAAALATRNLAFRTRIVQIMLLTELVLDPLPPPVAARVAEFAAELNVADDMISVAEQFAAGSRELAAADFARNGYLASIGAPRLHALHVDSLQHSWGQVVDDPSLATRWRDLGTLPADTIGRGVFDFYRDRGFVFPGLPGSAPPLLAQHDWVHVLAGYGTQLESELEVFGFIARANDDPRAFSLLAMVIALFETGDLAAGAGLFQADPGHLRSSGMAQRLADAMRRGALTSGSQDFLDLDWFAHADRPIRVLRTEIGLPPKAPVALAAGSAGPWQPGGINDYQLASARTLAAQENRNYQRWQPDPDRT